MRTTHSSHTCIVEVTVTCIYFDDENQNNLLGILQVNITNLLQQIP